MMMCLTKWLSAPLVIALLASTAAAADTTAGGKIKSINAEKKTFVVTNDDKDNTFKFDDNLVVNRDGKESKSDLKAGDAIYVCYDKGLLNWTAHYILVQEGQFKNSELIQGNVKGYEADKKELNFTNLSKQTTAYSVGQAPVRLNMEESKIEDVKIGDNVLIIVDTVDGKSTLRSVMVKRAK
jgi:Cu/Ag efflux protein CusF